ncbi:hypothetical protein F4561_003032 [Lipingzhangella halophila]|uniref:DUF3071 domain-containing protein n=1 Tax=Lipingzhangella halophila TaxID=1783352 RepID=A0A7W7RHX7_9ACTN|nr:septation protein SepH [Lipingzhangella halophila]MBB4932212.1 hypothetical protein [Lipingzhangella halophila]
MQELRLVAVSEDGTYLVLASTGRGTRFMLPVDDRLRAAVRGQFSRLGQYEIEVENPLRPKEIQARIRSGENAEAISEYSGIPIERVRWFESPVLQEREYMAQQAQRATLRRQGETTPGSPLGEIISDRIGAHQLETGDAVWDSWKREDNTWQLKLVFQIAGEERMAHWVYEPRRRSVTPADDEAVRLCGPDSGEPLDLGPGSANVTPFVPRRQGGASSEPATTQAAPLSPAPSNGSPSSDPPLRSAPPERPTPPERPAPPEPPAAPGRVSGTTEHTETSPAAQRGPETSAPARRAADEAPKTTPASETVETVKPVAPADPPAEVEAPAEVETAETPAARTAVPEAPEPPAARTPVSSGPPPKEHQDQQDRKERPRQREAPVSAAAGGGSGSTAGDTQSAAKRKGRGRRASVPSWDEIMFGSKKSD